VKIWFLVIVLAAGDNAIEQHVTLVTPDKEMCHRLVNMNDTTIYSKVYFTNERAEVREVLQKTCESRIWEGKL